MSSTPIKRVLIIRSGALGDLIYATVIIDALNKQFQEIQIDMVLNPNVSNIIQNDHRVHTIFPLSQRKLPLLLSPQKLKIVFSSYLQPYDLLVNLEQNRHFDALAQQIKAKVKLGSPYSTSHVLPGKDHMVDIIKQYLLPVCTQETLDESLPQLFADDFSTIKEKFTLPDSYLVFAPSNSHANRNKINYRAWPQEKWKALIALVPENTTIVLIGGRGEEEFFSKIKPYPKNVIDLTAKTSLPELITVIQNAKKLVTTDTGSAHLASAVNTDITVLIGPTNVKLTGPYPTDNHIDIISLNLACAPCYSTPTMHACTNNRCMNEISVETVVESLKDYY